MTYAVNHRSSASHFGCDHPNHDIKASRFGILRRAFGALCYALHESRRRQAEREIANFNFLTGRPISDDFERKTTRRFRNHDRC
jgi:hypothetical protein